MYPSAVEMVSQGSMSKLGKLQWEESVDSEGRIDVLQNECRMRAALSVSRSKVVGQ